MRLEITNANMLPPDGYPFCLYFEVTNGFFVTHTFIPVLMVRDGARVHSPFTAKLGRDYIPKYDLGNLDISQLTFYTTDEAFKRARAGRHGEVVPFKELDRKMRSVQAKMKGTPDRYKPGNWQRIQSLI
jgi:hypothetical protein